MRVLVLCNQKGGAGKTTLATSVACAARQSGETVAAIDTDPQGTLIAWGRRRQSQDIPVTAVEPDALRNELGRLRTAGSASLVVVDTAGVHGPSLALCIEPADFCLVPVKPSLFDVEAARPVVKLLRLHGKRFGFVLSQVNVTSTARNLDAASALVATNAQTPPMIGFRSDFMDAAALGMGVTEYAPKGKSANEVRFLWNYIKSQLGGDYNA